MKKVYLLCCVQGFWKLINVKKEVICNVLKVTSITEIKMVIKFAVDLLLLSCLLLFEIKYIFGDIFYFLLFNFFTLLLFAN